MIFLRKPIRAPFSLILLGLFFLLPLQAHAYCGDGILQEKEQCDDGNFTNRDGCNAYCELEDTLAPTVVSVSIPDGTKGVNDRIKSITISFSEPLYEESVNLTTIIFQHEGTPLDYDLTLNEDQKTVTIQINQELFSEASHAIKIRGVQDLNENYLIGEQAGGYYVSVFETMKAIDDKPPTVVARPKGGDYNFSQNVELKAYDGTYTDSDDFLDEGAIIYYTLNDININESSPVYSANIRITEGTTLRYFAVDAKGNKTDILTERYSFKCPEFENVKTSINKYPTCEIIECDYGFALKGNTCVVRLGGEDENDYKTNAATAPRLASDTPMIITTRPAIYVTPEHRGLIPRPVIFKDQKRGTIIEFEKNTTILDKEGRPFSGYIKPPENLYSKDFPINFGYSFKSIFEFKDSEGNDLQFSPPYKIIIPYGENFVEDEESKVFTYDSKTERYTEYNRGLYKTDLEKKELTISAYKTGNFFVAQKGQNFNRSVFEDTATHWAKNYIEALYRKDIVKGRSKGIYAPNENLTRAEFIKVALKSIDVEIETLGENDDSPFEDVPLYSWFAAYIKKAKELNLVKGYDNNTFGPDTIINRAEAVKILFSAFQFDLNHQPKNVSENSQKRYIDLRKSEWYYPYADFAIRHKIMEGVPSSGNQEIRLFGPANPITRAEMAKLAIKTIELAEELKIEAEELRIKELNRVK